MAVLGELYVYYVGSKGFYGTYYLRRGICWSLKHCAYTVQWAHVLRVTLLGAYAQKGHRCGRWKWWRNWEMVLLGRPRGYTVSAAYSHWHLWTWMTSISTRCMWCSTCIPGRDDVMDEGQSDVRTYTYSTTEVNTARIEELILIVRLVSLLGTASDLGLSYGTVQQFVVNVLLQGLARWVSLAVTDGNVREMMTCFSWLQPYAVQLSASNLFCWWTWIQHFTLTSKQSAMEWKHRFSQEQD
jgi:hypothetical protein